MYTVYHHIHHLYIVVHGGPGGGTSPAMARYFDPLVYKIVLVDQRGCGESLPFADLRENTTYDSVRDFEKIRVKLGMMMMMMMIDEKDAAATVAADDDDGYDDAHGNNHVCIFDFYISIRD